MRKNTDRRSIEARRLRILDRYNFTCVYCDNPATTVDHVEPWDWKHNDSESNLVAACVDCNSIAGDKIFSSFQDKREYILLVRSTPRWQKKFQKRTAVCTICRKTYNPRTKGASRFLCPKCYDEN